MTGERGENGMVPGQEPGIEQQAVQPDVTAEDLLQRSHDTRKQTVDARLGSLLVAQPVYYYREGDSTGTQG